LRPSGCRRARPTSRQPRTTLARSPGFTANGIAAGPSKVTLGSAYNTCPEGESFEGFIDPLAAAHTEDVADSTLMVTGNGKTVLPNTPVPTV
jgi:hypothetical protein